MFDLDIVDVGIGLVLVYLLMSLLLSTVREAAENILKNKGMDLEKGVGELLSYPALVQRLYDHPLVTALYRGQYVPRSKALPSYIPSRNFALALMDLAGMDAAGPQAKSWTIADLTTASATWVYKDLQPVIRLALQGGGDDLAAVQADIEAWYNSAMDRVTGWYKRRTQVILFVVGLAMAVVFNVNTFAIVQALKESSALREVAVAQAQSAVQAHSTTAKAQPVDVYGQLQKLALPVGWDGNTITAIDTWFSAAQRSAPPARNLSLLARWLGSWAAPLVQLVGGWLITAVALTLGAPFWFDALSKLVDLRTSLKPPANRTSPEPTPGA